MVSSLLVTALIETLTQGPVPLHCAFPARGPDERPIEIVMQARPSLKDLPGLYRVEMAIDGTGYTASAQPIIGTSGRDVLVRAAEGETTFYAVGFDDNGAAAFNVVHAAEGDLPERQVTRRGVCQNYERYIQTWSTS